MSGRMRPRQRPASLVRRPSLGGTSQAIERWELSAQRVVHGSTMVSRLIAPRSLQDKYSLAGCGKRAQITVDMIHSPDMMAPLVIPNARFFVT